jgi:hypothetical protein
MRLQEKQAGNAVHFPKAINGILEKPTRLTLISRQMK